MTRPAPRFDHLDLVARDFDATVAFYRCLGLSFDAPEGVIRHAQIEFDGAGIHIDNEHLAAISNASWGSGGQPRAVVNFRFESRDDVDARYADLVSEGHRGLQDPHDAFWGARYAIVADPDGTPVGLTSPIDDSRKR